MGSAIGAIYRRAYGFASANPVVMGLLLAWQLLRRALIVFGSVPAGYKQAFLIGTNIVDTVIMLIVMIYALRWWRFRGDRHHMVRLNLRVAWGATVMMAIQLTSKFLLTSLGDALAPLYRTGRMFIPAGALLLWLFISIPFLPWYVALFTDDRRMTLRRSLGHAQAGWIPAFALVIGAILPLLTVGIALRLGLRLIDDPFAWLCRIGEAVMVPVVIATTASAFFAAYRRVYREPVMWGTGKLGNA